MVLKMKTVLLLLAILSPFALSHADEKIDLILEELKSLREQVDRLETRLASIENAPTPSIASIDAAPSVQTREKKKWFDSMRVELKKAEVRASGAWTTPGSWSRISTGMKKAEAIAILGKPSEIKFSVRKDTDEILVYRGDLTGSGKPLFGEIRIYKGKVRRFVVPDLPAE